MKLSTAINGYTLAMLADGMSPHTINGYQWAFNRWLNYMNDPELETITTQDLRRMFASLQESNLASSSIQAVWRTMRSFYNWAEQELEIKRPDKNITMPRAETRAIIPFTEDEIKKLLIACDKTVANAKRALAARDKALILLLLDTGLRIGEACRLVIDDYTPETGELIVSPYRSGRKSKARTVYLGKRARKSLWLYLANHEKNGEDPSLYHSGQ